MNEIHSASRSTSQAAPLPSFRVLIVLPAFNEEPNLEHLLKTIDERLTADYLRYQIIVIDDGSSDRTYDIAVRFMSCLPITVHRHDCNKGLGATIRDGLTQAIKIAGDEDIIVTMDADLTHTPGLIASMVRMIHEGRDVVVASRYRPGSAVVGLALHRRLISQLASWLMRIVFPIRGIRDYTCGYRAYRSQVLKAALHKYGENLIDQEGFQCMVDILLKLRRMSLAFGEVPMVLRYDQKGGASKMKLLRTARQTLSLLLRRRCGR